MAAEAIGDVFSVEKQCSGMIFTASESLRTKFYIKSKRSPTGSTPMVCTGFCELPPNGKKDNQVRGVAVMEGKGGVPFARLKMKFTKETAGDVIDMCKHALREWNLQNNPTRRSVWYQSLFGLEDGTKVFSATSAIGNPEAYAEFAFAGREEWDAPSKTFSGALFGDDEDAAWYVSLGIAKARPGAYNEAECNSARLYLLDDNGKTFKAKKKGSNFLEGAGKWSYPSDGILLTDLREVAKLQSWEPYTSNRWSAKCMVQLRSIEWKCTLDMVSNARVIYPVFNLQTYGSIILKKTVYTLPEGMVPMEQRMALMDAVLFEGLDIPSSSKKRKRLSAKKTEDKADRDTLPDSDLEGEDDM